MVDDKKDDIVIGVPEDPEAPDDCEASDDPKKRLDEEALDECVEEFTRGVHSFHGNRFHSDLTIPDDVIKKIKETFEETFAKHLRPPAENEEDAGLDPREKPDWQKSGKRVRRIAFYAGSLAACYAHRNQQQKPKPVDCKTAHDAIEHVSGYCKGPNRGDVQAYWIFCPWDENGRFRRSDSQGNEDD